MWLFFGKIKEKNMKKIYLIRHAKAVKKGDDFERKLSKSGKDELKKLFKKLANFNIKPDFILSSPAVRTVKTAKKLAKFYDFDKNDIKFDKNLYLASCATLLNALKNINSNHKEIFLVGHNPAIMELAELLSSLCLESFPTSSMLCLEFDIDDFANLKEHSGKLVFFEHIRSL